MKNQSMTLILSFVALGGGLAAHAVEDDGFSVGPNAQQLATMQNWDSFHASEQNEKFDVQWKSWDDQDEGAERELELHLNQQREQQKVSNDAMSIAIQESLRGAEAAAVSSPKPWDSSNERDTRMKEFAVGLAIQSSLEVPVEGILPPIQNLKIEGAKVEASLLKSSDKLEERDTRKESDALAERVISAFAKAREKKKSLVTSINNAHAQVIALREQEKKTGVMALEAVGIYTRADLGLDDGYVIVDSAALEGSQEERVKKAKEAWEAFAQEHDSMLLGLREAIAERDGLLEGYFALGMQGAEEESLATRIREVRSQITRLEQEVKDRRDRALDASGEIYGELEEPGAPDEERKHEHETPDDLKAEATKAQLKLEAVINEETALITDYFNKLKPV